MVYKLRKIDSIAALGPVVLETKNLCMLPATNNTVHVFNLTIQLGYTKTSGLKLLILRLQ